MGRLKKFEIDEALEKAMYLFWKKGYDNTSLKDLLQEMNILNGSFYNTFGNKQTLFIKSLDHYNQNITSQRAALVDQEESFHDGIRVFFKDIFLCFANKETPNGCFLINSLSPELVQDQVLLQSIQSQLEAFENFFRDRILQAIQNKEYDQNLDATMMASILVTYVQGLMKQSNAGLPLEKLEKQTQYFLTSIGI
ncbi:TetR/AcrR family transcriptional regulator [bacterium]|nr:TetR/AcrR family transcriptional regulator [bacterium]